MTCPLIKQRLNCWSWWKHILIREVTRILRHLTVIEHKFKEFKEQGRDYGCIWIQCCCNFKKVPLSPWVWRYRGNCLYMVNLCKVMTCPHQCSYASRRGTFNTSEARLWPVQGIQWMARYIVGSKCSITWDISQLVERLLIFEETVAGWHEHMVIIMESYSTVV